MGATKHDRVGLSLAILLAAGAVSLTLADASRAAADGPPAAPAPYGQDRDTRPILMVAGMLEDKKTVAPLVDFLKGQGFDVTVYVPPDLGLSDIDGYAAQVSRVVEDVRRRTGAAQIDLIGHSQGGVTARRFIQLTGGDVVHTLISLGSPQQGSDLGALVSSIASLGLIDWAPGLKQLVAGSAYLARMNELSDPTPGDTRYVAIGTQYDEVTKPVARSGIPGGEHVVMQAACPDRKVGHFGLLSDGWVREVVLSVLAGGLAEGQCSAQPVGGTN